MCKLSCRAIVRAAPGSVRPVSAGKALGVCRLHAGVEIGSGEGNHVNVADLKSPLSEKLRGWKEARSEKQMTRSKFFDKLPDGGVLQGVRVVLVSPKFSANVGSAARLCANFECNDLWVVDPRCDPVGPDAQALAVGSPALSNITVVNSMTEAIQDCTVSVGFTRRKGAVRHVHASMNRLLDKHPDYLETETHGKVALVFGREDHGLELEELMACSQLCAIPTGRVQPSLNLSHSAGIALANCFERRLEGGAPIDSDMPEAHPSHEPHATPQGWPPATTSEVNRLVERWTSAAAVLGLPSVEYDGASICILTSWMHVFFCEFAISGSTIHACVYDMINMLNAGSAA